MQKREGRERPLSSVQEKRGEFLPLTKNMMIMISFVNVFLKDLFTQERGFSWWECETICLFVQKCWIGCGRGKRFFWWCIQAIYCSGMVLYVFFLYSVSINQWAVFRILKLTDRHVRYKNVNWCNCFSQVFVKLSTVRVGHCWMQGGRINVNMSAKTNQAIRGGCAFKTSRFIFYNRAIRFAQVGRLLFMTSIVGVILCYSLIGAFLRNSDVDTFTRFFIFMAAYSGGVLPLFAVLDARSRFQDYKKAKDLFFRNGFKPKIANLFIHSKCQRDALEIAAKDLGLKAQLDQYYFHKGYRWYHILPNIVLQRPGLLITVRYWKKTLFAPHYPSKYFLW